MILKHFIGLKKHQAFLPESIGCLLQPQHILFHRSCNQTPGGQPRHNLTLPGAHRDREECENLCLQTGLKGTASRRRRGGTDIHNELPTKLHVCPLPPPSGCENEHFPFVPLSLFSSGDRSPPYFFCRIDVCNMQPPNSPSRNVFFYLGSLLAKLLPDASTVSI